jgi:hypothetical protein
MRVAIYFPLPTSHYNLPLSLEIRMKHNLIGYAIYMILLQKIAAIENRAFTLAEIPQLAFELRCEESLLKEIIDNYFVKDDIIFWSNEVNESLKYFDLKFHAQSDGGKTTQSMLTDEERREKARKAGLASAEAKKNRIN